MAGCGFVLLASPFCQIDLNRFPGDAGREGARKVARVCAPAYECSRLSIVGEREAVPAVAVAHGGPCLTSAGMAHPHPAGKRNTQTPVQGLRLSFYS